MSEQLAYALITPYSIYKSRTGGIIGRLLGNAKLDLVATRMFVFSDEFVDEYQKIICPAGMDKPIADAWREYLDNTLRPSNPWSHLPRCMLLVFRGPDAVRHMKEEVIGSFTEHPVGDTIRGTYGDFLRDKEGNIRHFEPAVITCPDPKVNDSHLKLLAKYAVSDGGLLDGKVKYNSPDNIQTSLVMLKPDNFYKPSRRPGNIIDTFSLTGLKIVAAKLFGMTVARAEEFYGPLKEIFVSKLKFKVAGRVKEKLSDAFSFEFTDADADAVGDILAEKNAITEFNRIVEYMTGVNPDAISQAEKSSAGTTKCLALLYEGPGAIEKIRQVLGSTDPDKAEPGTVRSDFGRDLMRNGAHASDSPENAMRERKIIGLADHDKGTCEVCEIIGEYLANSK